jgi:hypothetical protein
MDKHRLYAQSVNTLIVDSRMLSPRAVKIKAKHRGQGQSSLFGRVAAFRAVKAVRRSKAAHSGRANNRLESAARKTRAAHPERWYDFRCQELAEKF